MMRSIKPILCLTALCLAGVARAQSPSTLPQYLTLGDKTFIVRIWPEPYRSTNMPANYRTRFDQTAQIRQVTLNSRSFLHEPWGLVDEFGIFGKGVLGYDQAPLQGSFLKVGVGVLRRDTLDPYRWNHPYPVEHAAAVKLISHDATFVTVEQSASAAGWGYRYVKRYQVDPARAALRIEYELTNTGSHAYPIEQYNHNWFHFDGTEIGEGYALQLRFAIDPLTSRDRKWLSREGERLAIHSRITRPVSFASKRGSSQALNEFQIQYDGGPGVNVAGDFAIDHFLLYADTDALCPEVFFAEPSLRPGRTVTWARIYRFRTAKTETSSQTPKNLVP